MFGVVDGWLYKTVAGIEIVDGKTLKMAPYFAKDLSWAKGEVSLPSGKASVSWRREGGDIIVEVKIPFNVKAEVQLGKDVLKIGSGEYQFKA
jgi:alpha-L-rhamnosidase